MTRLFEYGRAKAGPAIHGAMRRLAFDGDLRLTLGDLERGG